MPRANAPHVSEPDESGTARAELCNMSLAPPNPHSTLRAALPSRLNYSSPLAKGWRRRFGALCCASLLAWSCATSSEGAGAAGPTANADTVRYRLPLRDNPAGSSAAFRCYNGCQPMPTPEQYLGCLEQCPGFETTEGAACGPEEVPPLAVCLTGRHTPPASEPQPGWILATIAGFVVVIGLASVCASSHVQCQGSVPDVP
jgi:hypothetical protein